MEAYCELCKFKLKRPQWEHLIYNIRKIGGHAGTNECPRCHKKSLKYDFIEQRNDSE